MSYEVGDIVCIVEDVTAGMGTEESFFAVNEVAKVVSLSIDGSIYCVQLRASEYQDTSEWRKEDWESEREQYGEPAEWAPTAGLLRSHQIEPYYSGDVLEFILQRLSQDGWQRGFAEVEKGKAAHLTEAELMVELQKLTKTFARN